MVTLPLPLLNEGGICADYVNHAKNKFARWLCP